MKTQRIYSINHWPVAGPMTRFAFAMLVLVTTMCISQAAAQNVNESTSTEAYATVPKQSHADSETAAKSPSAAADKSGMQVHLFSRENPRQIRLNVNNPTQRNATLALMDERKNVIYQSNIQPGWSWKIYDLRELPEGRYTVKLVAKTAKVVRSFTIKAPVEGKIVF